MPVSFEEPPVSKPSARKDHAGELYIRLSRWWLAILALLIMGPWVFVIAGWMARPAAPLKPAADSPIAAASTPSPARNNAIPSNATTRSTGPWGDLEITRITTEPPMELASRFLDFDTVTWQFGEIKRDALQTILKECALPESQITQIMAGLTYEAATNSLSFKPPIGMVTGMSPEQRSALYEILGRNPRNFFHTDSFRYHTDHIDEWLDARGLEPEALSLARQLIYRRGETAQISDVGLLLNTVHDDASRIRIFKALARKSSLLVRLMVNADSDLPALANYWGRGPGRSKDILPLLESLSRSPGSTGGAIDIVHLLPSFARKRLYTYPSVIGNAAAELRHDCHWTSMNFWNDVPDETLIDTQAVARRIAERYHLVTDQPRLGDVLMLMRDNREAIHSGVYIADDIVFTKNGAGFVSPFILMRLSEMRSFYESRQKVQVKVYRLDE